MSIFKSYILLGFFPNMIKSNNTFKLLVNLENQQLIVGTGSRRVASKVHMNKYDHHCQDSGSIDS